MSIKYKILLLCLFFPLISRAQWNTGGDIDASRIHFGFQLGVNTNTFSVVKQPNFQNYQITSNSTTGGSVTSGRLQVIQARFTTGFHLGLVANMFLNDNLDLRFTPDVNFSDRTLAYGYETLTTTNTAVSNPIIKTISSTFLDFPLLLKFKSDRKGNIRSYIIGGLQYSHDIVPRKKTDDAGLDPVGKLVKINSDMLSYKVGLGLDLYYEYFKMSPEISITNGLINGLDRSNVNAFTSPLSRLYPTAIMFTLYFE